MDSLETMFTDDNKLRWESEQSLYFTEDQKMIARDGPYRDLYETLPITAMKFILTSDIPEANI